jgi:hypothetical protein
VAYVDTSALAKLVVAEADTVALQAWFRGSDRHPASCDLVRRAAPDRLVRSREVLDSITLVDVGSAIFEHAGCSTRPPCAPSMRSISRPLSSSEPVPVGSSDAGSAQIVEVALPSRAAQAPRLGELEGLERS